jgi:transcriptional regulator with XRE-family HTH domain
MTVIIGEQIKTARTLLGWSVIKLAFEAGASEATIRKLENGQRFPSADRFIAAMKEALETAGVAFAEGRSPQLKTPRV